MIVYFTIFPQYNYTCNGKLDARFFLSYFSGIYKAFIVFENSPLFYFWKYCLFQIFWLKRKETTLLFMIKYYHVWKKFFLIFKNSNITACDLSHPLKLKNLISCNTQWYAKIKFLETNHKKKHSWKQSYRFVIAHLAFSSISFKSTIMHLKISLYMFMFI